MPPKKNSHFQLNDFLIQFVKFVINTFKRAGLVPNFTQFGNLGATDRVTVEKSRKYTARCLCRCKARSTIQYPTPSERSATSHTLWPHVLLSTWAFLKALSLHSI